MRNYIHIHTTYDDYLVLKIGNRVRIFPMWKLRNKLNPMRLINKALVSLNLKPESVVNLRTGITVKHYKNGKIDVQS